MKTINTRNHGLALLALCGLAAGAASAAYAADPAQGGTVVRYADLNVVSAQGAATLYGRIHMAAVNECAPLDHGDESSRLHKQACVSAAVKDAVARAQLPALSAVYQAKNRTAGPVIVAAQK